MARILFVEDDVGIGTSVPLNLGFEGYKVEWARDVRSALAYIDSEKFDLALLDVGLPDGSGIELCQKMRERGLRLPIVMLTAQTDEDSVVRGLQAGANDYIRKPFGNKELLQRIKTALGETVVREDNLRFGDLIMSRAKRVAKVGDSELETTPREFDVLLLLAENGSAVVTRERLMDLLDHEGEMTDRTLDSHLSHIRRKFKNAGVTSLKISSVYGIGYMLEKQ